MKRIASLLLLCLLNEPLAAQVPQQFSYQGRVTVAGVNFDGTGQFKFSLVNAAGNSTLWSHDGTGTGGAAPTGSLSLPVVKGLYAVRLGASHAIPLSVFQNNADVRLRVWFDDGLHGTQQLVPDQPLASAPWALVAEAANSVKNGSVTMDMLSPALQAQLSGLLSWQEASKPVIAGPTAITVGEDAAYSVSLVITGVQSVTLSGAPAGTAYDVPTQTLSGTGPSSGSITFNLIATNGAGSTTGTVTLNTAAPIYVDTVSGLDTYAGTAAAPVKTITKGMELANAATPKRSVRVSKGTYTQSAALQLLSGIHLYGGYDRSSNWSRHPSNTTTITCSAANAGHVYAVQAIDLAATTKVDGFAITAGNATAPGASSYGVAARGCANLILSNDVITAGSGTAGADGNSPGDSPDATNGKNGGNGAANQAGTPGIFNILYAEGNGGTGGLGFNPVVSAATAGDPSALIFGLPGGAAGAAGQPGQNGGDGANGSNGAHGTGGAGGSGGDLVAATLHYNPGAGAAGTEGTDGGNGSGGGGGGGSKSGTTQLGGGGGGATGYGGDGGGYGWSGSGGGASLPVVIFSGTAAVQSCALIAGSGGHGGKGGNGGKGGEGGTGGSGGFGAQLAGIVAGNGGNAGDGGNGGNGGGGGGGAGGAVVGIAAKSGSTVTQSANTFTLGSGGNGGAGGTGLSANGGQAGSAGIVQTIKLNF